MAAQLVSLVGERIWKESAKNKFGQEDPYFEQVPASRLHRAFGKKTKKVRKAIPPGLSENDAKVLNKVKRRAYRLDLCLFNLCGIRFGWGSVIGLFPVFGDGADAALALLVLRECKKVDGGLPGRIYSLMLLNIIIDLVIGFVPFVGDLADAMYKCNTRNAVLLEKHLRDKAAKQEKARLKTEPQVDLSIPEEFDRYEEEAANPPSYEIANRSEPKDTLDRRDAPGPSRPPAARLTRDNPHVNAWFGGSKQKQRDPERDA
ncbi:protein of unknown function (DUF4112) domain containing protein [Elaphomyces granulatus]